MTSTLVAISLRTRSPLTVPSNSMSSMKVQVRNRNWIVRLEKLLMGYALREFQPHYLIKESLHSLKHMTNVSTKFSHIQRISQFRTNKNYKIFLKPSLLIFLEALVFFMATPLLIRNFLMNGMRMMTLRLKMRMKEKVHGWLLQRLC